MDRFRKVFQVSLEDTGVVGKGFAIFVHNLERDPLVRLVPERQVVSVNTYFVDPPVGFDGTDDMPLLPPTEFDELFGGIPRVKEDIDLMTFRQEWLQFHQHLVCQGVLAAIALTLFGGALPVETPDRLFAQEQTRVV